MAGARVSMSDRGPWICQASCGCLDGVAGAEAGTGSEACWGSLARVAGAPGTFQITPSVLGFGVSWFVHKSFNSRILVSYNFLALLSVACWLSKPDILEAQLLGQDPRAGMHDANFLVHDILSCLWVTAPGVCVLTRLCLCPSYLSQCVFFLISLIVDICSTNLQVILRDSHSICICSFGVSMGGNQLRIFLLCHSDPTHICFLFILLFLLQGRSFLFWCSSTH